MMRIVRILLTITAAGVSAAQAAHDWYSLGLNDRAVNCILADDTSTIFLKELDLDTVKAGWLPG